LRTPANQAIIQNRGIHLVEVSAVAAFRLGRRGILWSLLIEPLTENVSEVLNHLPSHVTIPCVARFDWLGSGYTKESGGQEPDNGLGKR
jgi:hypothetical protein